jgi:phosphotransferase system IIB component
VMRAGGDAPSAAENTRIYSGSVAATSTSASTSDMPWPPTPSTAIPDASNTPLDSSIASAPPDAATLKTLLTALGGRTNIRSVDVAASRLRIGVVKASIVDATAIRSLGLRGLAIASSECVHLIVGPAAAATSVSLRQLIA